MELRPYQQKAFDSIIEGFQKYKRLLLVFATGSGKTIVFAKVVQYAIEKNYRVLVLAHRGELVKQAIEKIQEVTGAYACREQAEHRADVGDQIVIATVQTLQGNRLKRFPKNYFRLIIVDETHHITAKSYQNILEYFTEYRLLGVTATPDRADRKSLQDHFDNVAYQYGLREAINNEYLCPIVGCRIEGFEIDLRDFKKQAGDYRIEDLDYIVERYFNPICQAIAQETADRKTLIFAPSVKTAAAIAIHLKEIGLDADYLSGQNKTEERERKLKQFIDGEISHLVNCALFTEGFDCPGISAIVLARWTMSRSLYAQMVGRGTRLYDGKDHLKLVEFQCTDHRLVRPFDLFEATEQVRAAAMQNGNGNGNNDLLKILESTERSYQNKAAIRKRLVKMEFNVERYDPLTIADHAGINLDPDIEVRYMGHKLYGPATERQIRYLERNRIAVPPDITKGQASRLIELLIERGGINKIVKEIM